MNTIIKLLTLSILTLSISFTNTINDLDVNDSIESNHYSTYDEISYELDTNKESFDLQESENGSEMSKSYVRIGAVCNDGWVSSATGSGACSWHKGVNYWLYGWR